MKNSLEDLHNHLFAQLERLSEEGLKGEELKAELSRAKGVSEIAGKIVDNGKLVLEAKKLLGDNQVKSVPGYLEPK
ncbi:hypothetical protein BRR54_07935 [Salmonella enterica]|nr:hypothetical protein [Salmonella enterica]EBR1113554.1 hypothetical protein [Salmonella enterica]